MNWRALAVVASCVFFSSQGQAALIDTVAWEPDATVDGVGTGDLVGTTVGYSSVGVGNAGTTVAVNWDLSLATDGAVDMGVTNFSAGVLGTTGIANPQSITFGDTVVNPILLVAFADATSSLDFGALGVNLLDSNNAQLIGSTVNFVGAANSANDGFAAQIIGTFGPGSSLDFTYTTSVPFDSIAFTASAHAVPEPTTMAIWSIFGAAGFWGARRRKLKARK